MSQTQQPYAETHSYRIRMGYWRQVQNTQFTTELQYLFGLALRSRYKLRSLTIPEAYQGSKALELHEAPQQLSLKRQAAGLQPDHWLTQVQTDQYYNLLDPHDAFAFDKGVKKNVWPCALRQTYQIWG
ncbi:uncharacterized protein BDCG_00039 [Blastomyces dermatitidis ER-3]|uniref:Uncharacterized protein n=1 Tax=Ajellomyces dermatitidis (strain ER-3 / ATCC MYA-2586) TaxID=559297 RepID=A0ABP2EMN8_AJEDR|nr:uncharacterized protein BDCG_00039 [Blastomyces dermatitidis ER-3]EEQ83234.2 hypothetical protein BDCG_00039 [Blastomyces dermatitidis ER-3]